MKTKGLISRWGILLASWIVLVSLPAEAAELSQESKTEFLNKAYQSYYSLKHEGMTGFQCNMTPNWKDLLAESRKSNPAKVDEAIKTLKQIVFLVNVTAEGEAKVLHNEVPSENDQQAKGLSQIYSGMEQMTTGFFQTWSSFVVTPALPTPGADFQLEGTGSGYRLTYNDGSADVVTTIGKDFEISQLKISTKEFVSTLEPQFKKTAKGLLLSGYHGDYQDIGSADKTDLHVNLDYQDVEGLQLPRTLNLKGTYGPTPFAVEVTFSGCHVTK